MNLLYRVDRQFVARRTTWVTLLALSCLATACDLADSGNGSQKVNGSVHVSAGKPVGAAATVNGGIDIDASAAVTSATTVNGGIRLGEHARAEKLETVNGSIHVGPGAKVAGSAESVNGGIDVDAGADVGGSVRNVNGSINVRSAHVAGGIRTIDGNISISGAARIEGGILIEKTNSIILIGKAVPRVEILPGSVVQGDLRFEREVKLYVSDKATIGRVSGATPITFAGDSAPPE